MVLLLISEVFTKLTERGILKERAQHPQAKDAKLFSASQNFDDKASLIECLRTSNTFYNPGSFDIKHYVTGYLSAIYSSII